MKTIYAFAAGAGVLAVATAAYGLSAHHETSPLLRDPAMRATQPLQPQLSVTGALEGTYLESGQSTLSQVSGFNDLDTARAVICPGPQNCIIGAEQHVQFYGAAAASDEAGVATLVGGKYMTNPSPPYSAVVPTDSTHLAVSFAQYSGVVKPGRHMVQTQVFTGSAANIGEWEVTYQVYSLPRAPT